MSAPFVHPSAIVDEPSSLGAGSRVWHFCHVCAGAKIGERTSLGQNVYVASSAIIGNGVKVQNNVSIYDGVIVEDDVFLGPSCVLTNVKNPRAEIDRRNELLTTRLCRGATIGANATIVCGVTIGAFAFVAAGAVVTTDVAAHALVMGVPARAVGWVSRAGHRLHERDGLWRSDDSDERYRLVDGALREA